MSRGTIFLWFGPLLAAAQAIQLSTPSAASFSIPVGRATEQVVTAFVGVEPGDPEILSGGVNLQKIQGNLTTVLGVMRDDGTNGDAQAGDGIYSLRVNFNEAVPTAYSLRSSVALRGRLQRSFSPPREFSFVATTTLGTLTVRTFALDSSRPSSLGQPLARPGTLIRINDSDVGTTGQDGVATILVPGGVLRVAAVVPAEGIGEVQVQLLAGSSAQADIPIELGTEPVEAATLQAVEAPAGILAATATTLTLRFLRRGVAIQVSGFSVVEISNASGGSPLLVTDQFELTPTGTIRSRSLATLRSQISQISQPVSVEVRGWDNDGFAYQETVSVHFQ